MANGHRWPARAEVLEKLEALAGGAITREAAADWARPWIIEYELPMDDFDPMVWQALDLLLGADLRIDPTTYIHDEDDFRAWVSFW